MCNPMSRPRIRQLEEQLGVVLFYRKSKGVCLTACGTTLYDYAERIIQLTHEARDALSDEGAPHGPLLISSMEGNGRRPSTEFVG